jgi:drug/metabolite transporter (DMT)-like permease
MSLWLAVALTLVGSSLMNLGIVLMKIGAMQVPGERREQIGILRSYFATHKGWLGLTLNFTGAGLFMAAISAKTAPISLLQPLATFGLVVNALLAVCCLGERFNMGEWLGVALLFLGVVMLGASAEAPTSESTLYLPTLHAYLITISMLVVVVFTCLWYSRNHLVIEVLYGLLAGLLLGIGYLDTKASALAWRKSRVAAGVLFTVLMVGGLLGGFMTLLKGNYRGRVMIVKSTSFVTSQVVVGVGGVFCLSEGFPQQALPLAARITGYALILGGFCVFATCRTSSA